MLKPDNNSMNKAFVDIKNHGTLMCKLNCINREVQIKVGDVVSVISFDEQGNLMKVV